MRQSTENGADSFQRLVPRNREVSVARPVVGHRMGETTLILKVEIVPFPEFANRMRGKELRRRPFGCRLPRNGFGPVLAELERRCMLRVRPGAARTIEPMRLIHGEQAARLLDDGLLATDSVRNGFESTPSCGCALVIADTYDIVFAHRVLHDHHIYLIRTRSGANATRSIKNIVRYQKLARLSRNSVQVEMRIHRRQNNKCMFN
jgi:hypothetical protein